MTVLIVLFTSPMYIICKGMRVNILSDNPIGPMVSHTLYLFEKKRKKGFGSQCVSIKGQLSDIMESDMAHGQVPISYHEVINKGDILSDMVVDVLNIMRHCLPPRLDLSDRKYIRVSMCITNCRS
jgi:hypothetical protein